MAAPILTSDGLTPTYYPGDVVRIDFALRNVDGALADPTTVTVKYRLGAAGSVTTMTYGVTAALTRLSVGLYRAVLALPTAGTWYFQCGGTGALGTPAGYDEGEIIVQPGRF